jgi:hypothetical protein
MGLDSIPPKCPSFMSFMDSVYLDKFTIELDRSLIHEKIYPIRRLAENNIQSVTQTICIGYVFLFRITNYQSQLLYNHFHLPSLLYFSSLRGRLTEKALKVDRPT